MKKSFLTLEKNYRIRKSFFILAFQFLFSQLLFGILFFTLSALFKLAYLIVILHFFNILIIFFLFISWHRHYYVIAPEAISHTKGVLIGQTQTYDLKSIRSVKVVQPFFGMIFKYGDLILESPLLRKDVQIKGIQDPYKHAKIIEAQRLKLIKGEGSITPVV